MPDFSMNCFFPLTPLVIGSQYLVRAELDGWIHPSINQIQSYKCNPFLLQENYIIEDTINL